MGLISKIIGGPGVVSALGDAAKGVAEVFVPSATKKMERSADAQMAALGQFGQEFEHVGDGIFDSIVNGLNRLPRPFLAFGTLGLFVFAMIDPIGFAHRMHGLNAVPEPLWWLLGAIVAFYFGARETHYFRTRTIPAPSQAPQTVDKDHNPALEDWRKSS